MKVNSFYPILMTSTVEEDASFYMKNLGFKATFTSDWYISLIDHYGNELAILDGNHETVPEGFNGTTTNVILNFEIDKIEEIYTNLVKSSDIKIDLDLKKEEFGQEHFIIVGPNKILIDIIKVIPASEEFIVNYE